MKVIFFDESGRRISLFEDTLASEYLYCVSRAMSQPNTINARTFIEEMESTARTRKFLEYSFRLKQTLLSLNDTELMNYICGIRFAGLGTVIVSEGPIVTQATSTSSQIYPLPILFNSKAVINCTTKLLRTTDDEITLKRCEPSEVVDLHNPTLKKRKLENN